MQALTDTIALRMAHLGFAVLYTFYLQVELVLMVLQASFVFCTTIGKYSQ